MDVTQLAQLSEASFAEMQELAQQAPPLRPEDLVVVAQGDHSTEVECDAVHEIVFPLLERLIYTLRLFAIATQPIAEQCMGQNRYERRAFRKIRQANPANAKGGQILNGIIKLTNCQEPWVLQVERARIPGGSHYGAQTVRVFAVTEWNTIEVIVQTTDSDSRRRANLCLPSDFKGDHAVRAAAVDLVFSQLSYLLGNTELDSLKAESILSSLAPDILSLTAGLTDGGISKQRVEQTLKRSDAISEHFGKRKHCLQFAEAVLAYAEENQLLPTGEDLIQILLRSARQNVGKLSETEGDLIIAAARDSYALIAPHQEGGNAVLGEYTQLLMQEIVAERNKKAAEDYATELRRLSQKIEQTRDSREKLLKQLRTVEQEQAELERQHQVLLARGAVTTQCPL